MSENRKLASVAKIQIFDDQNIWLSAALKVQLDGTVICEKYSGNPINLNVTLHAIRTGGFWNAWKNAATTVRPFIYSKQNVDTFLSCGWPIFVCDGIGAADLLENLKPGEYILNFPTTGDTPDNNKDNIAYKLFRRQRILNVIKNKTDSMQHIFPFPARQIDYHSNLFIAKLDNLEYWVIQEMGNKDGLMEESVINHIVNENMDEINEIILSQILQIGDHVSLTIRPYIVGYKLPSKIEGVIIENKDCGISIKTDDNETPTWVKLRFVQNIHVM